MAKAFTLPASEFLNSSTFTALRALREISEFTTDSTFIIR